MEIRALHDDTQSVRAAQSSSALGATGLKVKGPFGPRAVLTNSFAFALRMPRASPDVHSLSVTYPLTILVGELRQIWRTAGTSASTEPTCTIAQRWLHTVLMVSRSLV